MDDRIQLEPGIVIADGSTIYPTGPEWILAFAIKGCQWAIDMLESGELNRRQESLWQGENI